MGAYDQAAITWVGHDVEVTDLPFTFELLDFSSFRYGTLQVYVNGLIQPYDTYWVTDGVLTFVDGVELGVGDVVRVVYAL